MAYPFSLVRALTSIEGKTITGKFDDANWRFVRSEADGKIYGIDTDTITFNTGLFDHDDNEIFIGDLLQHYNDHAKHDITYEAEYIVEEGAFHFRHTEHSTYYQHAYVSSREDVSRVDMTKEVHDRLTQHSARQYVIIGNSHLKKKEKELNDDLADQC